MGIMLNTRQRVIGGHSQGKCYLDILYIITKCILYPEYVKQSGCITSDSCYINDDTPLPQVAIPLFKNKEVEFKNAKSIQIK